MRQLAILIPSIPSRFDLARDRYIKYMDMVGDKDVEILLFMDNKKRSIGYKREALKNICDAKYYLMADEDDELLSIDEIYEATFLEVDVIDFKVECRNEDGSTYIVTFGLGNDIEHNTRDGKYLDCKRPPFHNCAWHHKFKQFAYPDISYSEDWEYVKQCLEIAKTEHFIDKVLFKYNFDAKLTEASTSSNTHWTNPNE